MRLKRAEPPVTKLTAHLRANAARYFSDLAGTQVKVDLVKSCKRRASSIYQFDLRNADRRHSVVVKVPIPLSTNGRYVKNKGSSVGDRPRVLPLCDPETQCQTEHATLSAIHDYFDRLNDPRLGAVQVLDILPQESALVVEEIPYPSLLEVVLRSNDRRRPGHTVELETTFRNAGAWLRAFHRLPDSRHTTPHHTHTQDLIKSVQRFGEYLAEATGDTRRFHHIATKTADTAQTILPKDLPLGVCHDDYALHNIFVAPQQRVIVIDTSGNFRVPIYHDLAYFLFSLKRATSSGLRHRLRFTRRLVHRYESAFLRGYFGSDQIPFPAIRLFELQVLLDKWASAVHSHRKAMGVWRLLKRGRLALHSLFFRRYARYLLGEIQQSLTAHHRQRSTNQAQADDLLPKRSEQPIKVAYVMSRFPKLTETFILFEMTALNRQGVAVEVYPLLRARNTATHPEGAPLVKKAIELLKRPEPTPVMHPQAAPWVDRAHFLPLIDWSIIKAQAYYMRRMPGGYLKTLARLIYANIGSPNYLIGGLVSFPKAVYFARHMRAHGVTHVHAHFANHPAAVAFTIHRLTGIPYSFTAHGADLQVDQHMLYEKVAEAHLVVAISRDNIDLIVDHCGEQFRDKIALIHCGVDTQVFKPAPPQSTANGQATKPLTIICVGTLYEVKGHTHLIEACRLLRERGTEFQCHLIGDGSSLASLTQQTRDAGLSGHVHFQGRLTRDQIADFHKRADVLVAPSIPTRSGRREGIPVVLMEAMASGLPVVATSISGIPELVGQDKTGLLVPPADPHALADALARLARDPMLRQRLGASAREKVISEFDLHINTATLRGHFCPGGPP